MEYGYKCPHGGAYIENVNGYSLRGIIGLLPKLLLRKNVISRWNNGDLWDSYDMNDFGIIGDVYGSFDFTDILYLSDTGGSWAERYKNRDKVVSAVSLDKPVRHTDDIIRVIEQSKARKIYLLVHFEQWKDRLGDWIYWYLSQILRRNGKRIINSLQA